MVTITTALYTSAEKTTTKIGSEIAKEHAPKLPNNLLEINHQEHPQ